MPDSPACTASRMDRLNILESRGNFQQHEPASPPCKRISATYYFTSGGDIASQTVSINESIAYIDDEISPRGVAYREIAVLIWNDISHKELSLTDYSYDRT